MFSGFFIYIWAMAKQTTPTVPPVKTLNTQNYGCLIWLAVPLFGLAYYIFN